jgi:hypothetical protein
MKVEASTSPPVSEDSQSGQPLFHPRGMNWKTPCRTLLEQRIRAD